MKTGRRIEIRGTVQGVGFRPWVYRMARDAGVGGRVRNDPLGVIVEAFGADAAVGLFLDRLRAGPPPPGSIVDLQVRTIPAEALSEFVIDMSSVSGERALSIPPDLATCIDCEREVFDPNNARYHYPFTNCTHCGPRFTIATGVPYDRAATTMARFEMCGPCRREYEDVGDRRFHAQPNACPACGPRLALWEPDGELVRTEDPLRETVAMLVGGAIVAVKGLGGFHLACDATNRDAVAALRERKQRDEKPFAVMVRDLAAARALGDLSEQEEAVLAAPERPIVLVARRAGAAVVDGVAPDTDLLGLFLPYTPLHHLLLSLVDRPLVMTSANVADEPICADNGEAVARLEAIADALLVHDRDIATRCDDSVARVINGKPTVFRRSRGFVPRPVRLARPVARPVLACGAHLKNTFCLAVDDLAYLGPHIGDLENLEALASFESSVAWMQQILDYAPAVIAHDMHPRYLSTEYALARPEATKIAVQHHHAHVASAMAEHGLVGPVIGVAYDGTGYGTDGTAWGGELLVADYRGFTRLATFRPISLAGGDAAIRKVWRIALALVDDAFDGSPPPLADLELFRAVPERDLSVVRQMIARNLNAPLARGVGRYFDGVGALALARPAARYEGQVAVAWNQIADAAERRAYPYAVDRSGEIATIDLRPLVRAVVGDVVTGVGAPTIAAKFHNALVAATVDVVRAAVATVGRLPVVLTGGVFQNPWLAEGIASALAGGAEVYTHGEVPPGDGGIALGQALVADALAQGGAACV